MNWFGLLLAISTLCIIGLGFFWVIWGERYLGVPWWPYFLGFGIMLIIASLFLSSNWDSALMGVAGASLIWGSTELNEQAIRTELGWFPFNANKINPPFVNVIKKWPAPRL
jgi:hypothetical protein